MSQDFEFTEQHPPHEPLSPVESPPSASAPVTPSRSTPAGKPVAPATDPLYRSPISVGAGLLIVLAMSGGIGYLGIDAYQKAAAPGTPTPPAPGAMDVGHLAPATTQAPCVAQAPAIANATRPSAPKIAASWRGDSAQLRRLSHSERCAPAAPIHSCRVRRSSGAMAPGLRFDDTVGT